MDIQEMIGYYREQGAPQDQQMLIALLREAQEGGGMLSQETLEAIAQAYGIKFSMLQAIIRRVSDLRCENIKHRLEVCGTCRSGAALRDFIERTYGVKSGAASEAAGFLYRVTPCMKNCKNGPSVRWDGALYSHADEALVKKLIGR